MRYFKDRNQAGEQLADQLVPYGSKNCAVVALTQGAVLVGAPIAKKIHAALYLLMSENLTLPGENDPLAVMSSAGTFTYNKQFSTGQLEELNNDYRSVIDQQRMQTFQKLNRLVGKDGVINKALLKRHTIILVTDGLNSGLSLDVAVDFLKPIHVAKLIVATPVANVSSVDKMHILTDEIFCLGVTNNYLGVDHYYDENNLPDYKASLEIMKNIVLNW